MIFVTNIVKSCVVSFYLILLLRKKAVFNAFIHELFLEKKKDVDIPSKKRRKNGPTEYVHYHTGTYFIEYFNNISDVYRRNQD